MKQLFEAYQPEEIVQTKRIINTPSDFARKALFYVQETGYLKSIRSHLSERSGLNSYLFLLVLSGKGTFTYKGQSYLLNQNDCVLIDCMEHYTHKSDITAPWELLWVHFNGIAAKDYYQYFVTTYSTLFHTDNSEGYTSIIHELLKVNQNKEASWELVSSKLITDLLTLCIVKKNQEFSPEGESIFNKLYKVRDYLEQNYSQRLSLEEIASHYYISKFHLCREYKKLFGTTIIDSITMKRVTHAKELLRFTKMSIEDIALDSGYPDASYFNKVFQKMEGMTASEYRRRW
jgi:YesN/AraC family two-component response regulator